MIEIPQDISQEIGYSRRTFGRKLGGATTAVLLGKFGLPLISSAKDNYFHPNRYEKFQNTFIHSSTELPLEEQRIISSSVNESFNVSYDLDKSHRDGVLYEGVIRSNGTQFVCGEITGDFDDKYSMPVVDVICNNTIFRSALLQAPQSNRVKFHVGMLPAGEFHFSVVPAASASQAIIGNPTVDFFSLASSNHMVEALIKLFPQDGTKTYSALNPYLGFREDMLLGMPLALRKAKDTEKYFALFYGLNTKEISRDPRELWDMSGNDSPDGPRTTDFDAKQMVVLLRDGTLLELYHMQDTPTQAHDIPLDNMFNSLHPYDMSTVTSLQEVGRHGMVMRGAKTNIVTSYIPFLYDYDWRGEDWQIAAQVISFRQLLARGQIKSNDGRINWLIERYLGGDDLITSQEYWSR